MNLFTLLKEKEYPGRFLVLGKMKGDVVAVYGVTARSAASRAKRYVQHDNYITVEATDAEIMAQGDLSLLQYNPVYFFKNGLVIGNGRQTNEIKILDAATALEQVEKDLQDQSFEPDKYNTPRITGCILNKDGLVSAALHIIRADEQGNAVRNIFGVPLQDYTGMFISTYAGPNVRPTPSFEGEAVKVEFEAANFESLLEEIYQALAPEFDKEDLRVSIVGICLSLDLKEKEVKIINSAQV